MFEAIARIRALAGVSYVTTLLYVDVHKSPYSSLTTRPQRTRLDSIDGGIISILQGDGRVSFAEIGRTLGISEST
ncbi:AsnC family transcriptional regulator, partial [Rhizobium johnstonii]